jgi:hypothetical protein
MRPARPANSDAATRAASSEASNERDARIDVRSFASAITRSISSTSAAHVGGLDVAAVVAGRGVAGRLLERALVRRQPEHVVGQVAAAGQHRDRAPARSQQPTVALLVLERELEHPRLDLLVVDLGALRHDRFRRPGQGR